MNSKNKILIGCLALLLVMSIGYALFSDTITINGTATAKGEFSLTTTCDMDIDLVDNTDAFEEKGSVTDTNISCEGNIVDASATLGYPGSRKAFRVMVTNTGTIPARLKEVVELNNPDYMYYNISEGFGGYDIENCQGDVTNKVCAQLAIGGNAWDDFGDLISGADWDWSVFSESPILDPGETAYFYILMEWYKTSTIPGEPLTATLNAKFTWEQVTVE